MPETPEQRMLRDVAAKQERMLRARQARKGNLSAVAILGVVGWSVVLPTLAGVAIGVWLDQRWPGRISWSVTLLVTRLVAGCVNAWLRIREDR